jgi:hypothetical protein
MTTRTLLAIAAVLAALPTAAHADNDIGPAVAYFAVLCVAMGIYFLPTIIAVARDREDGAVGIGLANLFFGWSGVGWLVCFFWACSGRTKKRR